MLIPVLSPPPQPHSKKLVLQFPANVYGGNIGLRKPYAKTKVGESLTCMMVIDSLDAIISGNFIRGF